MTQQERRMYLIKSLLAEDRRYEDVAVPAAEVEQRRLLRGLMNVRPPRAAGREFLRVQDDYLRQELAEAHGVESIAFCCISTGVFRFPNQAAAEIAVATVRRYLAEHNSKMKVIFNVFKDKDREIYERLLGADPAAEAGAG